MMTLREQVVAEIMKLVRPPPMPTDHKPTIDELEKILNSNDQSAVSINPDGTVSVQPPPCTVGDVADAVLRVLDAKAAARLDRAYANGMRAVLCAVWPLVTGRDRKLATVLKELDAVSERLFMTLPSTPHNTSGVEVANG